MAPLPGRRPVRRNLLRRLDAIARDLNVVLIVIAIGLALLDLSVVLSQKAWERVPITRVMCE